jgi:predicted kinase
MTHLLIVRGLPGSGKSTLAKSLGRVHAEADMFMLDAKGEYAFDADKLGECHAKCLAYVKAALEAGNDVVVANTFSRRWEVMPYIELGFPFSVVICEGRYANVHNVPEDKIEAMARRWEFF